MEAPALRPPDPGWGNQSDFQEKGTLMMAFLIFGAVAGFLLGLRFKVFVLLPATLITGCAIIISEHSLAAVVMTVLATAALLQLGYFLGCVVGVRAGTYFKARTQSYRLSKSGPA
jgi:hypothetical protein